MPKNDADLLNIQSVSIPMAITMCHEVKLKELERISAGSVTHELESVMLSPSVIHTSDGFEDANSQDDEDDLDN